MPDPMDLCTLADVRAWLSSPPSGIKSVSVTAPGSGYSSLTITVVPLDGNGTGANITAILSGGSLVGVNIVQIGQGYTQAPSLLVSGNGSGAAATASLIDDSFLATLITRASAFFLNQTNRTGILPQSVVERRNGKGNYQIHPYWWPILSVSSVSVNGVTIPATSDGKQYGWMNTQRLIYTVSAYSRCDALDWGIQNIVLSYTYGWVTIPPDITQAVMELIGMKYKRRDHIDVVSKSFGSPSAQAITYSQKDVPPEVASVVAQYKIRVVIE